ncbi:MAG: DEAD/DEAH box helicase [Butyrivibrio sp.]|uniref:DEAD/DEAH box helicase n=1 Tax=Butyrivibrio sp. TaxID=28121 RepID=UPI0025DD0B66|nr:DEAD/DEAH box helicase [Butyrivibrio sp.]MCR5772995.1 DEAD/DEAH box helicase [Butyrivibrio sp.]
MAKKIYIDWRPEFTQTIRARGMDYYKRDKVRNLKQDGSFFSAEVSGSSGRRYMTFAALSDDFTRIERLSCTCPYAADGTHCKHEAALMYMIENNFSRMISDKTGDTALGSTLDDLEITDEKEMIGGDGFYIDDDGFIQYESDQKDHFDIVNDISSYRYFRYSEILKDAHISEDVWKKGVILAKSSRINISNIKVNESNVSTFAEELDNKAKIGDKICTAAGRLKDSYFQTTISVGPDYFSKGNCYVIGCERNISKNMYGKRKIESPICEHQAAILYLLKNYLEKEYAFIDATDRSGETLMKLFSGEYRVMAMKTDENTGAANGEKLDIEPVLSLYDNNLSVSFRLGTSKKYKIQRLNEFYIAVTGNRSMKIGRNEFNLSKEVLSEHGLKIFEFIDDFVKESTFYSDDIDRNDYMARFNPIRYKNEILLFGHFLDDFYDICCKDSIPATGLSRITGYDVKRISFSDEPVQARVYIQNMKDIYGRGIGIHVSGQMPVIFQGRRYAYFIKKDRLNRISSEDIKVLKPFTSISRAGSFDFRIGLRNLTRFYYDTLPWLREHAAVTFEDADWLEQYILPQATFSFFLDREKGNVTCKAIVNYDDLTRNLALASSEEDGFRDQISEGDAITILKRYFPDTDDNGLFVCNEDENEDLVYELLSHGLDELQAFGDVRHTDSFMAISIKKSPGFKMGVSLESNLLDLEISAQDMDSDELIELLNSYRRKKKYYRLKSGDYVSAESEAVENLARLLDDMHISLKSFVDGKMQLPAYRALYLDRMLEDQSQIYEQRDRHFKKLIQEFKTISDAEFEMPQKITGQLRKYQRDGYRWLRTLYKYGFGGILADEMGLGKTLQIITLLQSYYESGDTDYAPDIKKTSLVVVPASLVYNWGEELRRFAPSLNYVLITGNKSERDDIILNIEGFDVAVTSYDLLKRDIAEYEKHSFAMEIIDEAQYIKNHLSQAAKSVKLINAQRKFALTGTPIENRLSELWSIFDYLMPGLLYGYEQFRTEFEIPVMRYDEKEPMDRLRQMVTPFILRRKKADVLKDLPDKLEEIRYARMDEAQKNLYDAQVTQMKMRLEKQTDDEFKKSKFEILAQLTRLRQICCDPSLCFEDYDKGSCKTDVFMDMIEQVIEGEHKALVFSQFVSMLEILKKRLDEARIPYYEITGSTPKEKRIELVNAFNTGTVPVFLISLKAGGTGLNLTGADVVIHYDPWWNLAVQNQATDRAHRIGQRKVVTVFKLIAHGTIEDKIVEMQEKKRALAESILESDGISSTSLSKDDLLELLS